MLNLKKNLCLVKEQKREPSPSLLVGIGLKSAHIILGKHQGKVQVINSRTNGRKDVYDGDSDDGVDDDDDGDGGDDDDGAADCDDCDSDDDDGGDDESCHSDGGL